jgi:hypothetical protein
MSRKKGYRIWSTGKKVSMDHPNNGSLLGLEKSRISCQDGFPTMGIGTSRYGFNRKTSDVGKSRRAEETRTSTKMVSASVASVNAFNYSTCFDGN